MTENSFSEQMKGHSNAALMAVIYGREHYQPAAVEAALTELSLRNIPQEELNRIKSEWIQSIQQPNRNLTKISGYATRLLARMNPFQYSGVEKDIALIVVSISYYFVFQLLTGYSDLLNAFLYLFTSIYYLPVVLPYIMIPVGLYSFHKKRRLGWTLLCAWLSYSLVLLVPLCFELFHHRSIFLFSQRANASSLLVGFFIFGGMLYALNRKPVREALRISARWQWLTILLSATLTWFFLIRP
jgi:hypothetical protein